MSVEDWARREAEQQWAAYDRQESDVRATPAWGIVHAFDALLSDEAVEALARRFAASGLDWKHRDCGEDDHDLEHTNWEPYVDEARAALQAAVRAVAEGETK